MFCNSKQVLQLISVGVVTFTYLLELSVVRFPLLLRSFANQQAIHQIISVHLLLPYCLEVLLNGWLWSVHSGLKTSMKALHHVRSSGGVWVLQNTGIVIPESHWKPRWNSFYTVHSN